MKALIDRIPLWVIFSATVAMCLALNIMALLGSAPLDIGIGCLILGIVASACIPIAVLDEKLKKMTKGDKRYSTTRLLRIIRKYKLIEK